MDTLVEQVAEGLVDHPLPLDPRLAGEGGAFNPEREVAFAGWVVATVPAVRLAVVDELDPARDKSRVEPAKHFGCDRPFGRCAGRSVHAGYIGRFNE